MEQFDIDYEGILNCEKLKNLKMFSGSMLGNFLSQ